MDDRLYLKFKALVAASYKTSYLFLANFKPFLEAIAIRSIMVPGLALIISSGV